MLVCWTCLGADQIDPALFEAELHQHGVTAPKALDNAIVNYVRIVSGGTDRRLGASPSTLTVLLPSCPYPTRIDGK